MKKAYEDWNQVIEYDGKLLLNFKKNRRSSARNELKMGGIEYPNALDHQLQLPRLPVPTEQVHSGLQVGGKCSDYCKSLVFKEFSFKSCISQFNLPVVMLININFLPACLLPLFHNIRMKLNMVCVKGLSEE